MLSESGSIFSYSHSLIFIYNVMNCTLCTTPLTQQADAVYFICTTCGAYVKNVDLYFSNEQEKTHYEFHNNNVNDLGYQKFTSPITNYILENTKTTNLGLDFGCGKGPVITKQLIEKGYSINLYDPYFYPSLDYLNYSYKFIFSCEVFEHFYNPALEIDKLTKLLHLDGLLIVMTHIYNNQQPFENWYYRKDQTHVFIYTQKTVEYIAHKFGYAIELLTERLFVLKKKLLFNIIK